MKRYLKFIPAFLWMGLIFYLSSRQTTGIGGSSYWARFIILKSFHIIEYAILYVLLFLGFNQPSLSAIIAYIFGISDEIHQSFIPGRTAKFSDTLFDLFGIFIGFLVVKFLIIPLSQKIKLSKST
ncbi:MAG TPA: VanZ family protein [Candidatus Woesebacteria bacterium]|jgi:VanZ family protein|nr:VanZ family protein [Candidatus Shapirobacteria bacterium]HOR02277.1 VanZ family protein [Candidatus Woesebacteria bacterium]